MQGAELDCFRILFQTSFYQLCFFDARWISFLGITAASNLAVPTTNTCKNKKEQVLRTLLAQVFLRHDSNVLL